MPKRANLIGIVGIVAGLILFATLVGLIVNPKLITSIFFQEPSEATLKEITAKALVDHECNNDEWHFLITQIDSENNAPAKITVNWANGQSEQLFLSKYTGKTAHYVSKSNLTSTVIAATTQIYSGWSGEFNLSHGPCGSQPTPSPSGTPTSSSTGSPRASTTGTPRSTATATPRASATGTATPRSSASGTPVPTPTASPTAQPSATATSTANATKSPSPTPTSTITTQSSPTPTGTVIAQSSPTPTTIAQSSPNPTTPTEVASANNAQTLPSAGINKPTVLAIFFGVLSIIAAAGVWSKRKRI